MPFFATYRPLSATIRAIVEGLSASSSAKGR
jgi:hypothetical protein